MGIPDILNELGIPFCRGGEHHHVREGWLGLDCPRCPPSYSGKGKFRLGIEISTGRCNCWVCGRFSLQQIIADMGRVSYGAAKDLLAGVRLTRLAPAGVRPSGILAKPKGIKPMEGAHRRYLVDRGFDPDSIERLWNVQGIGLASDLKWRLFVPIILNGQEISWTTRSIGNGLSRYITASPEQERLHYKNSLYGIDLVRTSMVITEGPTDVWNIGPGAVATYGLNFTPAQVSLMAKFPHRVVCFDNSVDAQRRADNLCDTLSMFHGKTTRVELDADDPGSASKEEIRLLRKAVLD